MDTQLTVNKFIFSLYVILRIKYFILHSHPFVRLNLFHQFRVITGNNAYIYVSYCFTLIPFVP